MGTTPRRECRRMLAVNITDIDTKGMEIYLREQHNIVFPEKRIRSILKNYPPKYFEDAMDNLLRADTDSKKETAILFLTPFFTKEKSPA